MITINEAFYAVLFQTLLTIRPSFIIPLKRQCELQTRIIIHNVRFEYLSKNNILSLKHLYVHNLWKSFKFPLDSCLENIFKWVTQQSLGELRATPRVPDLGDIQVRQSDAKASLSLNVLGVVWRMIRSMLRNRKQAIMREILR